MPAHESTPLRLTACPQCGYDLRGNPPAGVCPECGIAYDRSMFFLPIAAGRATWIDLTAASVLAAIFLFVFFRTQSFGWNGPAPCSGILALALIAAIVPALFKRRKGAAGIKHSLLATAEGLRWNHDFPKPHTHPWNRYRSVTMRQFKGDRWRLIVKPHLEHIGTVAGVNVLIHCTRRDAARIRNELRRRIRAANISSHDARH